jgi:hypothetical protein
MARHRRDVSLPGAHTPAGKKRAYDAARRKPERNGCPGAVRGRLLWAVYDAARVVLAAKTVGDMLRMKVLTRLRCRVDAVAADEHARRTEARTAKPRVAPKRRRRVR